MTDLKQQMQDTLEHNILRFWIDKMTDNRHGGYYGRMDGHDRLVPDAEKGAILNARILWSFAAAYRVLHKQEYLDGANRVKRYIINHFYDPEFGGVYWSVDAEGRPLDTKKQIYAIGFTIYGMAELVRANGDAEALEIAQTLFHDIENHAFDPVNNGYTEALTCEWGHIDDMRLSDKDENMSKTMNTHLHIIEPYTNLLRVWRDPVLERQTRNLLYIFTDIILNKETSHLDLFFNDEWQGRRNIQSFGHDIEASWLLHETALVLGDKALIARVEPIIRRIADAADEGLQPNGAMIYERWLDSGRTDMDMHWWPQCESVIGHINLWQHFHDEAALRKAEKAWQFIKDNLIDSVNGEWHWSLRADGTVNLDDDKAGFWKCPYHNSRMCLELIERTF